MTCESRKICTAVATLDLKQHQYLTFVKLNTLR